MSIRNVICAAGLSLVALSPVVGQQLEAAAPPAGQSNEGFIYGTVKSRRDHSYTGFLRWDDEEAFWDDLFNSAKEDSAWTRYVDRDDRRHGREIKVFGFTIGYEWHDDDVSRLFYTRFGDVKSIEVTGRADALVTMKSGSTYEIHGSSNDVGTTVYVTDSALGEIGVDWRNIERIDFRQAPPDAVPNGWRIYGTMETDVADYRGFIQWDSEEALSHDELDGETRDGDVSIPMGQIAAIEKRNRDGSWVELRDGRRLLVEGTNDVDSSINGIYVEDERYGRVKVDWDSFRRLELERVAHSGRSYDSYRPASAMHGTVRTRDGRTLKGRIVYDLDESEPWELLNGYIRGVEYFIPFHMVRSVEPMGGWGSRVTLIGGTVLELDKSVDVTDDNAGILVLPAAGGQPEYVTFDDVKRLELD